MAEFFNGPVDLAAKFFPFESAERNAADRERGFHLGAGYFSAQTLAAPFVRYRSKFVFFCDLQKLLVEDDDVRKQLEDIAAPLQVSRRALFDIPEIGDVFEFFRRPFELFGELNYYKLYQSRPADRLLHPEFAPLHASGKVDFSLSG